MLKKPWLMVLLVLVLALVVSGCSKARTDALKIAQTSAPPPATEKQPTNTTFGTQVPQFTNVQVSAVGSQYESVEQRFLCLDCHVIQTPKIVKDWAESKHGYFNVKCFVCHGTHDQDFVRQPTPERCRACHAQEVADYKASKHDNSKNFKAPTCKSCHPMHTFSLQVAKSAIICTNCHLDKEHVQLYPQSKMGVIFRTLGEGSAAMCVNCHMPKSNIHADDATATRNDRVPNHNVTETRDREKMVQVCLACHSERSARQKLFQTGDLWKKQWLGEGPQ